MKRMVSYVCCLAMIMCASAQAGLVAHYSFEDTIVNPGDTVVNSATGTGVWGDAAGASIVNSGAEGIVNNAFDFEGLAYVNTNNKLSATEDFTLAGWVNIAQTSARSVLFGQYADSLAGRMIFYSSDQSNGSKARLFVDSGVNLLSTTTIDDGEWHYLVVTRSGNTFTLFVDGVSEDSAAVAGISLYQGNNLAVGNLTPLGSTNIATDGIIDEVSIYNEALSATDILAAYNAVPEPATLMILGLGSLALLRKKRGA